MAFNPERLKEARKKSGLTQRGLSDRLKVSVSTVRRWEHGETEPAGTELALLCLVIDTTSDWLLDGPLLVAHAVLSPDEIQFLADFRSANPNTRQLLRECLRDNLRVAVVCAPGGGRRINGNGKGKGKGNQPTIVRASRRRTISGD